VLGEVGFDLPLKIFSKKITRPIPALNLAKSDKTTKQRPLKTTLNLSTLDALQYIWVTIPSYAVDRVLTESQKAH
jgi:hypothetical protein